MYCVEILALTCKTYLQPIFLLQKSNCQYRDPSNPLYVKFKVLKFHYLVDFILIQIMYKAKNKTLPLNSQKRFEKKKQSIQT